jgi:hypothetical protein
MSDILLMWNKKDLSDLKIATGADGLPLIFDDFVEATNYAERNFVNFERVHIGD